MKGAFRYERCGVFLQFHVLQKINRERRPAMKLAKVILATVAAMGSIHGLAGANLSTAFKDALIKGADTRVRICVQDEC